MALVDHPKAALDMSKKLILAHYNSTQHSPQVDIPLHQVLPMQSNAYQPQEAARSGGHLKTKSNVTWTSND